MKKVSIIIPAYNAGEYVSACLESVLNQTFKDIEIIVINDGSTDNTLEIINEYKTKAPDMITVIDQKNQGLSQSRNNGIKAANGEYIVFVDSDDTIRHNAVELLYNKAVQTNADVVAGDTNCVYPHKNLLIKSGINFISNNVSLEEKKKLFSMYVAVWNKIYKRQFILENELFFEPGMWFEDVLFDNKMIPKISSIAYIDEVVYNYIQRPNSITYTYSEKLNDVKLMIEKTLEFYKSNNLFSLYKDELEYMCTRYMLATYIKRLSKAKNFKIFKKAIKESKDYVKMQFPDYRKNPYLKTLGAKGLYLKYFNFLTACYIYVTEKDKMN